MNWNRKAYPKLTCTGPLGFPMTEIAARVVETLLQEQPKGKEWEYKRAFAGAAGATAAELLPGERADVSVITSAAVDRDLEVVWPAGIALEEFRKNPIVTFAHQYDQLPVGKALWIKRDGDRLKAKTRYSTRPADWISEWLPDAVWHLVQSGDLAGKSIGFLPLEGHPPTPDEIILRPEWAKATWVYSKGLLLEYAVAPIPANAEALVEAVAKGQLKHAFHRLARPSSAQRVADRLNQLDWSALVLTRLDQRRGRI
jgi:hypothetical protein